MKLRHTIYCLLPLFMLSSCDMEKEIELALPYHEPQLVVECYLVAGRPFTATVLESSNYFEAPSLPLVPDVAVYITTPTGTRVKLEYKPSFVEGDQYYTHISTQRMKGNPGDVYTLEVVDGKGRRVTAHTTVLPLVPIEEVTWKFNDKEKAFLLTSYQDNPDAKNFYRYMTHRENKDKSSAKRDFAASDDLTNGERTSYGSGYDYERGDTLIVSLFHIEEQYYNFLNSTEDAKRANRNPFSQPSRVKSSVQGGIGIFTNLVFDRKKIVIE